jgi:hypothetical protein
MMLVMGMSGTVHRVPCYALGRAYKVVAPEIDATEARAFTGVRKPWGSNRIAARSDDARQGEPK